MDSIHSFLMGAERARAGRHPAAVHAGLDAVAIADVDGDGCNDVVGAGGYGRGIIHLADGAGGFDGGRDLPQLGYQNPATATRVTLAVGDLTGDGLPELVVADPLAQAVMVYGNHSTAAGGACYVRRRRHRRRTTSRWSTNPARPSSCPPPPTPTPPPVVPRTCSNPGTTSSPSGRRATTCWSARTAATCSAAGAGTTACSGSRAMTG